jgi:flagellar motor switch protein FliG
MVVKDLPGVQKSAILMLSLDAKQADQILQRLPLDTAETVRTEMALLREIPQAARAAVLDEYRQVLAAEAEPIAPFVAPSRELDEEPFSDLSITHLTEILHDEHPQFVCAVLSMMSADKSGQCINGLSIQKQIDVFCRMACVRPMDPRVRAEVIHLVEARRSPTMALPHPDADLLARVLDDAHEPKRRQSDELLEEPISEAPENLSFDDLMQLDIAPLRLLLDEVEREQLALALRTASPKVRRKILISLPTEISHAVKLAAEALGPVHLGDVESAQARILRVLHRFEAAGDVKLKPQRRRK